MSRTTDGSTNERSRGSERLRTDTRLSPDTNATLPRRMPTEGARSNLYFVKAR